MSATTTEPLTVKLPCCPDPDCRRVGKISKEHFGGKGFCTGTLHNKHKRRRMVYRTFQVVEGGEE